MINIINKKNNFDEHKNVFYIGRGSPFGNYIFTIKPSQYNVPVMPLKEGLNLFKKDLDEKYENNRKFKWYFNQILDKIIRGESITLSCFCINKKIDSISSINLDKIKCHGEILAFKLMQEYERYLSIHNNKRKNMKVVDIKDFKIKEEISKEEITPPKILELIARGGHGKDTVLLLIKEKLKDKISVEKESMAFYIKSFISNILKLDELETVEGGFYKKDNKWFDKNHNFISNDVIDIIKDIDKPFVNEKYSFYSKFSLREMLRKLGTEFFRKHIDEDFHVKVLLNKIFKKQNKEILNVFSDIRFQNELDVFLKIGNKENCQQLKNLSDSLHINLSNKEIKTKLCDIRLGVNEEELSPEIEKSLKNEILKLKQMSSNNDIYLNLKDCDLKDGKTSSKVLRIFRVITKEDEQKQRKMYEKFGYDFDKEKDIVGYLREGINPKHSSEESLALQKPYYEYNEDELIFSSSLKETEEKLDKWLEKFFFSKQRELNTSPELN